MTRPAETSRTKVRPQVAVVVALVVVGWAVGAQAQQGRSAEVTGRARAAAARVQAELDCLRTKREELDRILRAIREADTQASAVGSSDAARRDARAAIESLEQRVFELDRDARRCRDDRVVFPASYVGPGTTVVQPRPDPAAQQVAQDRPSLREVEHDAALVPGLRVVSAEQVDGTGQIPAAAVRAAVRGVAVRMRQCYDRMIDRGALVEGQLVLVFTVAPDGRAGHVAIEGDGLPDRTLRQCITRAGQGIRVSGGARGGSAQFSYTLRFAAE